MGITLICQHCKREVDKIIEVYLTGGWGPDFKLQSCEDCVEVLMEQYKKFDNYESN